MQRVFPHVEDFHTENKDMGMPESRNFSSSVLDLREGAHLKTPTTIALKAR